MDRPPKSSSSRAARVPALPGDPSGLEHRRLRSSLERKMFGRAGRVSIGRYLLAEELGRGGMGIVYGAHDPRLDRGVAIKVLRSQDPAYSRRLEREAQTLAQLQHPNVVKVFDVGRADDQVYIVMQRVRGQTLAEWLDGRPHRTRIMAAFRDAARGLSAAHAVGIVHRDFKPGNVLVSDDGTILVSDFGLARAGHPTSAEKAAVVSDGRVAPEVQTLSITRAGTPAYMAPEQHDGDPICAATDQFAFCAALVEALSGRPAFVGDSAQALRDAKRTRPLGLTHLDSHLEAALGRGLAERPEDRWSSIDELLAQLSPPSGVRRWAGWSLAVLGFSVAASVGGSAMLEARDTAACIEDAAELRSVWNDARREAIDIAVEERGPSFAAESWLRLQPRLDDYSTELGKVAEASCRRGSADGGEETRHVRACLDARARRLHASLEMLADEPALFGTAFIIGGLSTRARSCSDEVRVQSPLPRASAAVLARIDGLRTLRRYDEAALLAQETIAAAPDENTRLRASVELGRVLFAAHRDEEGGAMLSAAFVEADRLGDRESAIRIAATMTMRASDTLDLDTAAPWARELRSRIDQRDTIAPTAHAGAQAALAVYFGAQGDAAEAERRHAASVAVLTKALGANHPQTLVARGNAIEPLLRRGRLEEAAQLIDPLIEKLAGALGPRHPRLAVLHQLHANLERARGDWDKALSSITMAIDILDAASEERSRDLAIAWAWRASILKRRGALSEARADYLKARDAFEAIDGPRSLHVAAMNGDLAAVALRVGDAAESVRLARRAFDGVREVVGAEHEMTLVACVRLLDALLQAKLLPDLRRTVDQCAPLPAVLETDAGLLVNANVALGRAAGILDGPVAGLDALEAAVAMAAERELSAEYRASAAFRLAVALHDANVDRPRAARLVQDAVAELEDGEQRDELVQWLASAHTD